MSLFRALSINRSIVKHVRCISGPSGVKDDKGSYDGYFEKSAEAKGDPAQREFMYFLSGGAHVAYATAARAAAIKLISFISAAKDVQASASAEYEIGDLEVGRTITVKWRGKPVFVRRRSQEDIDSMRSVPMSDLKDPQKDEDRAKNPEWLVLIAICTHLGCVPVKDAGDFGGWLCPCHGSHYDKSGRIRQGPAPANLEVPPYEFLSETRIKLA